MHDSSQAVKDATIAASDVPIASAESLDDLDFATEPGFVGVVDTTNDALEQREDCIDPG